MGRGELGLVLTPNVGLDGLDWLATELLGGDFEAAIIWFSLILICVVSSSINASMACIVDGDTYPPAESAAAKIFPEKCPAIGFTWVGLNPSGELRPSSFDTHTVETGVFLLPLRNSGEAICLLDLRLESKEGASELQLPPLGENGQVPPYRFAFPFSL
ncbi:hypothetical protein Ancab_010091 [Ancistrocladus abbreviatus]